MSKKIVLEEVVYEFEYKGQDFSMREPTIDEVSEYNEKIKEGGKVECLSKELLISCGAPKEVINSIGFRNIEVLLEEITGDKKKRK